MSKLKGLFLKFYLIFFGILLINIISLYEKRITIVFFSLLCLVGIVILNRLFAEKIDRLSDKAIFIFSTVAMIFITTVLIVVGFYMFAYPKTDWGILYQSVQDILSTGHIRTVSSENDYFYIFAPKSYNDYFLIYPNNFFSVFMLTAYYKFLTLFGLDVLSDNAIYAGIVLNIIFIDAAIISGALCSRKLYGKHGCIAFLLFCIFFVPYYVHAHRFYTDTLSLPFPIAAVLFYLYADEETTKRKYIYYALMGLTLVIGTLVKGSVIIVLVAIVLEFVLKKINRKNLFGMVAAFVVIVFSFGMWNAFYKNCKWIDNENYEQLNLPVTHWIMMALRGDGGYNQGDFQYSNSFNSKEEKMQAHFKEMKKRIESYKTVDNFIEFELNKVSNTFADNRYIQNNHLEWCRNRGLLFEFIYESGKYFSKYSAYVKIYGTTMFILWIFAIINGIKCNDDKRDFFINIIIFGVIIFFTLWETRSRYLLNFTPIFLLCAVRGIDFLAKYSKEKNIFKF